MTGSCANCLMQIDGIPNVRACIEPVRDGMRVERQNAWPSAGRDIHGWLNTFSFMMPPGFYYKVFQRPRWAWHMVEPFIRSKAGLGTVPRDEDHASREVVNLHCDVLVIGGGSAGLAAAAEAAAAGADTLLLEQRTETDAEPGALATAVDAGVRILTATPAFGVFDGPLVAAASRHALYRVRARHIVFATGAVEQAAVFPNNDLPGIVLSSAVERLIENVPRPPGPAGGRADVERGGVSLGPAPQGCRRGRDRRRSASRRAGRDRRRRRAAADRPSWRRTAGDGSPA